MRTGGRSKRSHQDPASRTSARAWRHCQWMSLLFSSNTTRVILHRMAHLPGHSTVYQAENIQRYTGKSQQCRNPIHLHLVASHLITRVRFTCCDKWINRGHAVTHSCIRRLLICFPTAQTQIITYLLQHCSDCYLRLLVTNSLHLILAHFY